MQPGHRQLELDRLPARQRDRRARAARLESHPANANIRRRAVTDAPHRHVQLQRNAIRAGIVGADDHTRRASRKVRERILQRLDAAVTLEVIGFDVVHDGDRRPQRQERLVVHVSLDDVQLVTANPRVATPCSDTAAGESCGVSSGGRERFRDHHRGGRLAVCPGDRHEGRFAASLSTHQVSQRIRATDHREV